MDALKLVNENADTLQSIATLAWINTGDSAMLERVTALKLGYTLWSQLSGEQEADALRNQTIAAIAKYVKDHPNAKKEDLQKEISRHIFDFARKVEKL